MFDFIEKYKYYIGFFLAIAIIFGGLLLLYNKNIFSDLKYKEDMAKTIQLENLKRENDDLKKQINEINIIQGETSATVKGEDSDQVEIEKININEADITELDKLPGVGPARAQDIIDYRDQNAGFDSIEEIKNIKGIGDATFEKMKDMISVD